MLDINDLLEALKTRVKQFPDRSAKWLLENTENLRGLLEIIASNIVECLDFSKVEIKNTTFIPDNLREQESDLVYLLPFRDKDNTGKVSEVLVYILLEHQSTVDRTMGFRILFYMCQIWDSQRREFIAKNLPKREWRFQPIIPIIYYTGDQKWETFPSLETLMDLPEALNRFVPKFDALLLDVKRKTDEALLQSNHPFGWLLTMLKQETADTEAFIAALMRLGEYLRDLPEAERAMWQQTIYYLHLLIFYRRPISEQPVLNQIVSENLPFLDISEKEKQLMQSMAEHYLQQGETRTKREDILKLVKLRFHNVPVSIVETIRRLDDRNQLETLFEKAVTTQSLEELLTEVDALVAGENHSEHSE